jgi:hypothetical protein
MFCYRCNNPKCIKGRNDEAVDPVMGHFDHPHRGHLGLLGELDKEGGDPAKSPTGKLCPVCNSPVYMSNRKLEPA